MNNEKKKDQLETMLEEFIAKYPDCKIDWEHKSEKDIDFKIKNGIDIEINICCLPEPVLSKKNDDGLIDFGADPEVTKKLTKYFNKKGKKLRKQKFQVATEDSVFFIK